RPHTAALCPYTTLFRSSLLGQRVSARMAQVRACYEQRIEEDPTITGTLRLRCVLESRGQPRVEVDQDRVNDAQVLRCITRVLARSEEHTSELQSRENLV